MSTRRWLIAAILVFVTVLAVVPIATTQDTLQTELAQTGIFTEVYNRVSPSVVAINVVAQRAAAPGFGQGGEVRGSGSGFVIDTEGHIVTNNHVVEGATRIEVNFFDGTLAHAEVVGLDPDSDLAVLDVDLPADRLYPVEWGNSDELVIGQPVLAIGSPFGQRWTLTSGIVSAVDRTIQGLTNFSIGGVIQTDTSINPGNSGGPLLDLQGRVIGVNSQIISESGSSAGVGFAIPSNLTRKVSQSLIEDGYVSYSYLGISGGDVTLSLIDTLELTNNTRGVVVADVTPGSPAARAGLRAPAAFETVEGAQVPTSVDIITAIDGQPLSGIGALVSYLAKHTEPGDSITLSVLRNGTEQLDLTARLTPRP
jgi:S1-C subfamily serine protease